MRISTKGRYGLRVLIDVALHEGDGAVSLRDISRRQDISRKYLWQVVNPLKAVGILRSTRGAQGGYMLARDPADISLYDIVKTLEGDDVLVGCLNENDKCERCLSCVSHEAWKHIETRMNEALREITLGELIRRHKDMSGKAGPNYDI